MEPFDICYAKFPWRDSTADRPWLLIRPDYERGGNWLCFAISTKDYDSGPFEIPGDDPDFEATGLKETSYVYDGESFHSIPRANLKPPVGWLSKKLLERFKKESGIA